MSWRNRRPLSLLLLLAVSAFPGCGGRPAYSLGDTRHRVHPLAYEGTFVEALDQLYAHPFVSKCDLERKSRMYALALVISTRGKKKSMLQSRRSRNHPRATHEFLTKG